MVTYAQLMSMDTSKLTTAASASGSLSSNLSNYGSQVQTSAEIPAGMWSGADASAAGGMLGGQAPPLFDASDAFNRGQATLESLAEDIDKAKEHLQTAHDAVAGTPVTIAGDGAVSWPPGLPAAEEARAARTAETANSIIQEALKMAEDADQTATAALSEDGGPLPNDPLGILGEHELRNAEAIIKKGREMGMDDMAIKIALATALVEGNLNNYSSSVYPETAGHPNAGKIGSDHDSVGVFQQRPASGWGSPMELMDVGTAAGKFYTELAKIDYHSVGYGAAQMVQRSAHPERYAARSGDAEAVYNAFN